MIRESFVDALRDAEWMSEKTRRVAEEKVETIIRNVGYPPHILNQTYMEEAYTMASIYIYMLVVILLTLSLLRAPFFEEKISHFSLKMRQI